MSNNHSSNNDTRLAKLHDANLSIFVKKYELAKKRLIELSETFDGMSDYEIQMRRIELYARSGQLADLRVHFDEMHFREILTEQDYDQLVLMTDQYSEKFVQDEIIAKALTLFEQYGSHAILHYVLGFCFELKGEWKHSLENYLECQKLAPNWSPVKFGLSQVYYQLGDTNLGDQYFFQYEQACPFNVYGNFQTHKEVFRTFFEKEHFDDASLSIDLLKEWWVEHKESVPTEVDLLKVITTYKIALKTTESKSLSPEETLLDELMILLSSESEPKVLVFSAQILDEFELPTLANKFFKKALEHDESQDSAHQTLSYWLKNQEEGRAQKIYANLTPIKRASPSVAFCELVVNLRISGNDVESYIVARDRAEKDSVHAQSQDEWLEILATLKALEIQYKNDPHLYRLMSKAYSALNATEAANIAIDRMAEIDPFSVKSQQASLEHAISTHDSESALKIIEKLEKNVLGNEEKHDLNLLKFDALYDAGKFKSAHYCLEKSLVKSPWNSQIIVRSIVATILEKPKSDYIEYSLIKDVYARLRNGDANLLVPEKQWKNMINLSIEHKDYETAYSLAKVLLMTSTKEKFNPDLFHTIGLVLHPQQIIHELSYILNTQWDSLGVYLCIAKLYSEIDQLETAACWLELGLARSTDRDNSKDAAETLLLDIRIDLKTNPSSEIMQLEFIKEKSEHKTAASLALLKGYIKVGQLRSANNLIAEMTDMDLTPVQSFKKEYYYGLLLLRSGRKNEANSIWKPLIKSQQGELVVQKLKKNLIEHYYEHSELSALKN